jgi:hypothetical protein
MERNMQNIFFNTCGDGYWSTHATEVKILNIKLSYVNDEKDFGELCVYFDTEDWNVNQHGLIYTDSEFLFELQTFLGKHGLSKEVDYSEQGMQGDDYVSLDVEEAFITSWAAKFGQAEVDKIVGSFA